MRPGIRSFAATAIIFCAVSLSAATVSKLNEDTFAQLREPGVRRRIVISVPLSDRRKSDIELVQFEVWAPGGKVWIHSDSGVQKIDPPARRFYRGLVDGEPESFAFLSVDAATQEIDGLISIRDRQFTIGGRRAPNARPTMQRFDDVMTETEPEDEMSDSARTWRCDVDKMQPNMVRAPLHATGERGQRVVADGISGTQSYAITVEIETDNEMYVNAGSNATTVTNYVTNLTGALSTIYNRDLKTNVTQQALHVYTTASDPWTADVVASTFNGLIELGDYYHNLKAGVGFPNTVGRTTSAVVMLSGKDVGGGIAWEGVSCRADFKTPSPSTGPDFGGPYSWCGGITKLFGHTRVGAIPNVSTPPYTVPPFLPNGDSQDFWPLIEYTHELGHNLAGRHTHCIPISGAEATAAGRSFVDNCFNGEGGCFSGTQSAPPEKGTIMSYCHNAFVGLQPQSRYTFGQPVEPSHHELDDFMLNPTLAEFSPPFETNIVTGVGAFTISSIAAPATVGPSSTGNAASISAIGGATYAWTITNGTITAGQGTQAITFTAGASGTVTLRASAYSGTTRCGVTDTKAVPIVAGFSPPTNVVATFNGSNAVTITWTAPAGGTPPVQYDVYRSSPNDYTTFTKLPTSPTTTSLTDSSIALTASYLYKVRSANAGGTVESGDSNVDIATTVIYTNPTITAGTSPISAADLIDLRTAANAVRALSISFGFAYTNPTITAGTSVVNAVDMTETRLALTSALSKMSYPVPAFTDPTLTGGTTKIRAIHFIDLRNAMQ